MAGTLVISTLSDGTNSTSATNPIRGSAKVWVNFDGTTGTIRSSFNVSSVTRVSTGDYTVSFTTALGDANYSALVTCGGQSVTERTILGTAYSLASASTKANASIASNAAYYDPNLVCVACFR